jgi:hypothetical protein
MINEYGTVDGMIIGRGNLSTWRKPTQVPLCAPQIAIYQNWDGTRLAVVRRWRLTAWAML